MLESFEEPALMRDYTIKRFIHKDERTQVMATENFVHT